MKDFFISYNKADRELAEWIARQLTDGGYSVVIQAWDILPGDNFVLAMHRFASEAERTIAVLSPDYLTSAYTPSEWAAAFAQDPTGEKRTLVPVRVRECSLEGLLRQIVYIDLVGKSDDEARQALLEGIKRPMRSGPAPPSSERLWNVPYRRNTFFTGRDQVLKDLQKVLRKGSKAALTQVAAIAGLGGIGKTQTAVEYAYRHRDDYKSVFWVRAESDSSTTSGFLEIAGMLNLATKDAQESVQAVIRWLGSNAGWLLIFDNADEPEKLKPFLPTDPKGHILITSRAQVFHGLAHPVRLEVLAPEKALEFLLKRTEREGCDGGEKEAAAQLAKELGYLPLALEQAGAFISENSSQFGDYLASYLKQRLDLLNKAKPIAGDYKESVATTWLMNFSQIEAANPASADLLRFSAFLDPDSIPLTLIVEGREELGPLLSAALGGADQDPLVLDTLLQPLTSYSLIRRDPSSDAYGVHRMVQEAVRGRMDEAERRAWARRAVLAVNAAFPDSEFGNWPVCEGLLPHAAAAVRLIDEWHFESTRAARFLNGLARYKVERGRYADAGPPFKRALGIRENALGPDHPDVAQSLNNLAVLYYSRGRYKDAEPLYRRALGIKENALGPDDPDVAQSLNNLAALYHSQGRYKEAEPLYERALGTFEKVLGPDHTDVAVTLNNLAEMYRVQGRHEEGELLYKRSLAIKERVLGSNHPSVATSLNNLALVYKALGRYEDAQPLLKRALEIREKALGPDHPDVAANLNNLALLYRSQGGYEEAEPLYKRALGISEKALGPDHPDVAASLNNLAELHRGRGAYEEAEPLYDRAVGIREKALSPDHPDIATSLNNLALLHKAQGRLKDAEPLYKRALGICEGALGPDHPEVAISLNNLAELYKALERRGEAEPLYERALLIYEKALGPDHPHAVTCRDNLRRLYEQQGRTDPPA
jgi:tetratricopeptide (TPR) repeat protein